MAGPSYPIGGTVGTGSDPSAAQATLLAGKRSSDGTAQAVVIGAAGGVEVSLTAGTATLSTLASAATSAQAIAANTARKGLIAVNTDAYVCYIAFGQSATTATYTVAIDSGGYWEMPRPVYTGALHAIWDGDGSGSLVMTELT